MKISVLGTGSWGSALANVLADNGHQVQMWGKDQKEIEDIDKNHHNRKFFATELNHTIRASANIEVIKDSDILLLAVPSIALETVAKQVVPYIYKETIIVNVAKGFHPVSHERLSLFLTKAFASKPVKIVALIGPSHAEEVVLRLLTSVNAVSLDDQAAQVIQNVFSNGYFRVYRNSDMVGAEIGVALKNIMAIASGILEGIGQGDNAKAALMTRGLAEISRYGLYFGAKAKTFLGLDGVGDLIVTCTSHHSRNFMAGLAIGKADSACEFLAHNNKTVEGTYACKVVYEDAKKFGIEMPITNEVYAVLYENKKPSQAMQDLMARSLKAEFELDE